MPDLHFQIYLTIKVGKSAYPVFHADVAISTGFCLCTQSYPSLFLAIQQDTCAVSPRSSSMSYIGFSSFIL
ncbi:hypothetical protein THIOM_003171 [Candidatus Thiomargarita nelsonii]|uniref:Uncharacterized protein n=1 Tax=Candidatus Thiomargarita nelsonii TaxID=1003181 RepID=A0A176RZ58_9GAMM|nr:hypothetical protein THIOM_003171 [Candidatus Thiomargarita nelsonii]